MKRRTRFGAGLVVAAIVGFGLVALSLASGAPAPAAIPVPHPTVSDFQFISSGTTPPTEAVRWRVPASPAGDPVCVHVGPLYAAGNDQRRLIAIVDSWEATRSPMT
jgi:hypothetical protein